MLHRLFVVVSLIIGVVFAQFSGAAFAKDLNTLVQRQIVLEEELLRDFSIQMDGYSENASSEALSFYISLMEKIASSARSRKYLPRDATEDLLIQLKAGTKSSTIEVRGKSIRLPNDAAAVERLISYFEGLPAERTLSERALVDRIMAFIREGDDVRVSIEGASGEKKEIRFQPKETLRNKVEIKKCRWVKVTP